MHKKLHYIANVNNDSFIDYIYKYRDTFISNIILFAHIASQAIVFTAKKHSWCGEEFEHLFCLIVCCGRTNFVWSWSNILWKEKKKPCLHNRKWYHMISKGGESKSNACVYVSWMQGIGSHFIARTNSEKHWLIVL